MIHNMGGYQAPGVLNIVLFFGFLSCIVGFPIPFISTFLVVAVLLWLLLFFGGFMMPAVTGMIINSAPDDLKELGSSFAYVCYN